MFENTGNDRAFLANVDRIASALERIVELMERPPELPVSVTEWRHDVARRDRVVRGQLYERARKEHEADPFGVKGGKS